MKVLIVDDRPENQLLLREQLKVIGAETVDAESGVRALRELKAQAFDLVVTDLLMPEMDGFQLCYLVKTDPKNRHVPVIVYTANYATRQDVDQASELGADDFITRPIDEETLVAKVRQVLEKARLGKVAAPHGAPKESFVRQYSALLIEKLEDQLITAEENSRLSANNVQLQRELEASIRELREKNGALERVNRDLEAYSYTVAHDLRAPVRAIKGMIAVLAGELKPAPGSTAGYSVERINQNADLMNDLIGGLLEHSALRNVLESVERVDLHSAVESALGGLDTEIEARHASVACADDFPLVMAHRRTLVQAISNLIDNALKFVAPGVVPHIAIACAVRGGRARLTIHDNGIGIEPENHERIFGVFERLHPPGPYPGTGIGLAIVRRAVEQMGGSVGVDSSVTAGSAFWIELPLARPGDK